VTWTSGRARYAAGEPRRPPANAFSSRPRAVPERRRRQAGPFSPNDFEVGVFNEFRVDIERIGLVTCFPIIPPALRSLPHRHWHYNDAYHHGTAISRCRDRPTHGAVRGRSCLIPATLRGGPRRRPISAGGRNLRTTEVTNAEVSTPSEVTNPPIPTRQEYNAVACSSKPSASDGLVVGGSVVYDIMRRAAYATGTAAAVVVSRDDPPQTRAHLAYLENRIHSSPIHVHSAAHTRPLAGPNTQSLSSESATMRASSAYVRGSGALPGRHRDHDPFFANALFITSAAPSRGVSA